MDIIVGFGIDENTTGDKTFEISIPDDPGNSIIDILYPIPFPIGKNKQN